MKTITEDYSRMRYVQVLTHNLEHEERDYVRREHRELLERVLAGADHHFSGNEPGRPLSDAA